MTVLWLVLAATAGFTAGHYRLPGRAFDQLLTWAQTGSRPHSARRVVAETAAALLLLAAFTTQPRRTLRSIRTRRVPEERLPTPQMDPSWGQR